MIFKIISILCLCLTSALSESYEDKRCRCICPGLSMVLNHTVSNDQKLFVAYVPPSQCNCDGVVLPKLGSDVKGREAEFCTRCECKYETRNTTIILVVVIMVLWMVGVLVVYMGFLICLDPMNMKRKYRMYRERVATEANDLLLQCDQLEEDED